MHAEYVDAGAFNRLKAGYSPREAGSIEAA